MRRGRPGKSPNLTPTKHHWWAGPVPAIPGLGHHWKADGSSRQPDADDAKGPDSANT